MVTLSPRPKTVPSGGRVFAESKFPSFGEFNSNSRIGSSGGDLGPCGNSCSLLHPKSLLSKAEVAFHKVLLDAVPEAPIFPKVRVADVMDADERYSGDFLRISQKHFDWVLCHPISFEPLIAIELDDSSHQWSHKQRKNDQVKDEVAQEAGIQLLRFPWQPHYDAAQIREKIATELDRIAHDKEGGTINSTS